VPSEGYTAVEDLPELCLRLAAGLKLNPLILPHQNEGQVLSDLVSFICVIGFSKKIFKAGVCALVCATDLFESLAKPANPFSAKSKYR
jgi:hypothetical protein